MIHEIIKILQLYNSTVKLREKYGKSYAWKCLRTPLSYFHQRNNKIKYNHHYNSTIFSPPHQLNSNFNYFQIFSHYFQLFQFSKYLSFKNNKIKIKNILQNIMYLFMDMEKDNIVQMEF